TARPRINELLKRGGSSTTQAPGGRLLARGLIVTEIALAVTLLCGAGLMVQSIVRVLHVDLGYRPENLIIVRAQSIFRTADIKQYNAAEKVYHEALFRQFASLPGVGSVGVLGGGNLVNREYTKDVSSRPVYIDRQICGLENANPFATLGVPLIEG